MIEEVFTDREVAVIIDSLAVFRAQLQGTAESRLASPEEREEILEPTPNIDSALEKLKRLVGRPDSNGFRASAG